MDKYYFNNFEAELKVRAPGRINLIGEHIDYNGGFVLPAAIDKSILLQFRKNGLNRCHFYSRQLEQVFVLDLSNLQRQEGSGWSNYLIGVLHYIQQLYPNRLRGFDCVVDSNLPLGAGLSSSAALECGLAKGVDALFELGLSDEQLIDFSMAAEHHFVGTKCGVMDQFAVVRGEENKLMLLNCQNREYSLVDANFHPYTLVLLNSKVSHSLASSAYNTRRMECQQALSLIQQTYPQYSFLADVPTSIVREMKEAFSPEVFRRALFVSEEQGRVLQAVQCLKNSDFEGLGQLLYATHWGLSRDYEVSCEETDFLVESAEKISAVLGARMMGGGFGGCTLNLVHKNSLKKFTEKMQAAYFVKFNQSLQIIPVSIRDGVNII